MDSAGAALVLIDNCLKQPCIFTTAWMKYTVAPPLSSVKESPCVGQSNSIKVICFAANTLQIRCKYAANSPIWVMDGIQASPQNGLQHTGRFCTAGLQKPTRTTLRSGYIPMTNPIRNLIGMLMLSAPLALLAANGPALITYPQLRPVISIAIDSSSTANPAISSLSGIRRSLRYCLEAQIAETESLQVTPLSMVGKEIDIYVGIISPNQRVRTWTPVGIPFDKRDGILNDGIVPYAQKYIPEKGFTISEVKLERSCYTFQDDDPIGLYSWFVWLVQAGKPLENPQNWLNLGTSPFFLLE